MRALPEADRRVSYDPDTLELDPAFCGACERATWNAPVEFMVAEDF